MQCHKPASPNRVPASCPTSLHMIIFWLKSASTVSRALLPIPSTVLARMGAITSVSIGAVGNCLVVLLVGYALQPARAILARPWFLCAKAQHVLSQECMAAGRVFVESQTPQNQWSEAASEGAAFIFNFAVGSWPGVYVLDCSLVPAWTLESSFKL